MIFNEGQERIINEAIDHVKNSSEQTYQFSGKAGTGKSVVLNEIIRRLGYRRDQIAPMSYIGQSTCVMRLKGLINARTEHSWLYDPVLEDVLDENGKKMYDSYYGSTIKKLSFVPVGKERFENIKLIIVDEAGSTPMSIRKEIDNLGIKVIACGDLNQLPPVIEDPGYLYTGKVSYLDEIMRQKANDPILYLADRAIKGLPIQKGFYGNVLVISRSELTDDMISASNIVIAGKNNTREDINYRVRNNILRINSDLPTMGEKLICRKNNWNLSIGGISLTNGLVGQVVNSPDVGSFQNNTFKIDFKPDLIDCAFRDIDCDYEYLKADQKTRLYLKNNSFNKANKFEFGYCITTHSAQGSEYPFGIYMEEFLNPDIQANLNYTGITRFRNGMIYVLPEYKNYYTGYNF